MLAVLEKRELISKTYSIVFYFLLWISLGKKPSTINEDTGCQQNIINSWNPSKSTDHHIVKYMLKISRETESYLESKSDNLIEVSSNPAVEL